MILTADYHTHTPYSHGKNTVAENVAQAAKIGLKQVAITDHGFTHLAYGIRRKEVEPFMAECRAAEAEYGIPFSAAVAKGNVYGCQFHPEKSGNVGLSILRGFCETEGRVC